MDWDELDKKFQKEQKYMNLSALGIRVFSIVKVYEPDNIENNYTFATNDYVNNNKKQRGTGETYQQRMLDVRVMLQNKREYNQLMKVRMSERVFRRILVIRDELNYYHGEIPPNVIYWKLHSTKVWIALISDDQFKLIKPWLLDRDYHEKLINQKLKDEIPWVGYGTRRNLMTFKRWYHIPHGNVTVIER